MVRFDLSCHSGDGVTGDVAAIAVGSAIAIVGDAMAGDAVAVAIGDVAAIADDAVPPVAGEVVAGVNHSSS